MSTKPTKLTRLAKLLPAFLLSASLFSPASTLRAEEESKADKLRTEAKRLLQLANEVDRQENADDDRKPEKPKGDKHPTIKKHDHEGDIKAPVKPEPKKGDKVPPSDKLPASDKHPHPDKVPYRKDAKPIDAPAPRVKLGPDGKPLPPKDTLTPKAPFDHPKHSPDFKGPPPMKQPPFVKSPGPGHEVEQKLMHMMQAAKHLREAGMIDMADNLEKAAGDMKRHLAEQRAHSGGPDAREDRKIIDELRREVAQLRETVKRMQHEDGRR